MIVDHIGYAVNNIVQARIKFEKLGYSFVSSADDETRNLRYLFLKNNGLTIELIQPLVCEQPSIIDNILKNGGAQPYHICYVVPSLTEAIDTLKKQKYIIVHPPKKAIAMGGANVVFLFNKDIGLIELVSYEHE